jgi:hypothetical protein
MVRSKLLWYAAVLLMVLGVAWRLLRYVLQFPIWGDEAFISLNLLDRDYVGLLGPLRFGQVAPVLFLWTERAALQFLGDGEWALRLFPLLAGLGALALFWRLAWQILRPLGATLAVGIFAVSYYPVRHSCEVKPYAFDLFMALALLTPAVAWLREPQRLRWLALLAALVPVALAASYPAVFVAGAVSLALLAAVCRHPGWGARGLYALYNLLLLLSFIGVYRLAAVHQFHSTGGTANSYWGDWFAPHQPVALARWLVEAHTGNMLAYPVGGHRGASTLTTLLCLAGAWQWLRARRWDLLHLGLTPFALTFLAAFLHRYPYGGSARIAQHLAPGICLLAGCGLAGILTHAFRTERGQSRAVLAVCALLAFFAVGGMGYDIAHPYKTPGDRRLRQIIGDMARRSGPETQFVVVEPPGATGPTFEWYVRRLGERVAWHGGLDERRLDTTTQEVWCLHYAHFPPPCDGLQGRLAQSRYHWDLAEYRFYQLPLGNSWQTIEQYEIFHWVRRP